MTPSYVELHARSAYSFLRGASNPEELAEMAAKLELPAMALCDRDGVYGAPRFYASAREIGVRPIVGSELTLEDGSVLPVLVQNRTGYQNLSRLITQAKLRGTKDHAPVRWDEIAPFAEGLVAMSGDEEGPICRALSTDDRATAEKTMRRLVETFGEKNVFVEVQRHLRRGEEVTNDALFDLADHLKLPALATNGVLHADPKERAVLDVFTCARNHTHLDAAGRLLSLNAERHLKPATRMARLFTDRMDAITNTVRLAERLDFSLEKLGYEFPRYQVPPGETMDSHLRKMTMAGARARYSHPSRRTMKQIEKELALIAKLGFSGYFLIVWDIVNFCTAQNIMVQGRGSAANSVVCYCLGITACDPIKCELLFERFLSEGRTSWPDIDIDLPSGDRRERVIQEVYQRYGKHGAAMTANVITYRGRSAMREIGKALNFPLDVLNRFSSLFASGDFPHTLNLDSQLEQAGIPKNHPRTVAAIALYGGIYGLPRHLGQHSGGMIICQGQLDCIVPLENASMPGRVVAQWSKDDCDDLGIIKVDLLGLGMMAVLQDTVELCAARGEPVDIAQIPVDDKETYDLMCRADTIGVFQIESRAQMATLPRMQPREFYDLVVEVAIIRPGPIQGEMLHPFLARRTKKEEVTYYHPALEPILKRTLGVPLFQEQLLGMAMAVADFTGSEAEELRRALSYHRSQDKMNAVCAKLRAAMVRKEIQPSVIDRIVTAVQSFAVYGFPESHAISFAIIAYASCWLKVHRAPEFYAGLLNNQPMGFYSPATLVLDAKRHGVRIRPVNVQESDWFCTVEDEPKEAGESEEAVKVEESSPVAALTERVAAKKKKKEFLRLGLCYIRGMKREEGERIVVERKKAPFTSLADFQLRSQISKASERALAAAGALNGLAAHRRDAQWKVEVLRDPDDLFGKVETDAPLPLRMMNEFERTQADYTNTGLTTGPHPMLWIREQLADDEQVWRAGDLEQVPNGTRLRIGGMVICRQRPGTAKGFVFISLEDETGVANAIVTPQLFERERMLITSEQFMVIEGILQNVENVIHVKAERLMPLIYPGFNAPVSHDFH